MVGKAIQQGSGELFAAEHLRPLGKLQVGGDDQRLPLVALGYHLEEQLGPLFRERRITHLVDDQKIHLG
jgi:hypothetical protein